LNRSFAAQAWVIWLISIVVITLASRNPFYILVVLLIARIVESACGIATSRVRINFRRLALIIVSLSVLFNLLMVRVGQTVLFTLPQNWWLIGGSKSLEAAVYGAVSGLILVTLLAIFLAFNASVPVSDLVRLTPRALANIGLVVLLAITYVPETINQLHRIREAQALRGHRLRGLRDWQPIVIPLLIGGLERSMGVAESMVSRGYGSTANVKQPAEIQLGLLIGLLLTLVGWLATFRSTMVGIVFIVAGMALVFGLIIWSGKGVSHTRYRSRPWNGRDWLLIALSITPLLFVFIPLPFVDNSTLFYTPYPVLTLPPFDPIVGLSLVLLAAPAVLVGL